MKMKLKELVEAQMALQEFRSEKVKPKFAFMVKRATRGALEVLVDYHEARNEIIKKHGLIDAESKQSVVIPGTPGAEKAEKELKDLLQTEVEFSVQPIPESEVEKYYPAISGEVIDKLEWAFLSSGASNSENPKKKK